MNKELMQLYKSKPELIQEHKRLVEILRHGSDAQQKKEAERQLKELKEMLNKEELEKRCWEGYKPVPGKKPYEKGSCEPVSKKEDKVIKVEKNGQWSLGKSNSVKPFGQNIYDATANITRKQNRTGEEVDGTGPNVAVHQFTPNAFGTARQQAERQAKEDTKKNKLQEVKSVDFSKLPPDLRAKAEKFLLEGKGLSGLSVPNEALMVTKKSKKKPKN